MSRKPTRVVVEEVGDSSEEETTSGKSRARASKAVIEEPEHEEETSSKSENSSEESEEEQVFTANKRRGGAYNVDQSSSIRRPVKKFNSSIRDAFFSDPFKQLDSFFGNFDSFGSGFSVFDEFDSMGNGGNVQMYSYSSCKTIGPDGHLREETTSSRRIGGSSESQRLERDSRLGREELSWRRGKDGRARETKQVREKSGKTTKKDKYYNMTPEEAEEFDRDWNNSISNRATLGDSQDRRTLQYVSSKDRKLR